MAAAINLSPIALNTIPIPPDAEPVIPAKIFVVTAPFTNGFVKVAEMPSLIIAKPGSAAMTPPNPNSAPVFIVASSAPPILVFNPAWKPVTTRFQYNNNVVKIPIISANSTDQIPTTALNSTFPNAFIPIAEKSKPLGYHFGIIIVNTLFITPTKISGINAISCCALVISMLLINGIFFCSNCTDAAISVFPSLKPKYPSPAAFAFLRLLSKYSKPNVRTKIAPTIPSIGAA